MNIALLKKFMLEFIPDDAQAQFVINDIFNTLEKEPALVLNNSLMWTHMNYFKSPNRHMSVCAANGMILGFALSYALYKYPHLEKELEQYIVANGKVRGENVINFLQKKGSCI